MEFMDNVIDDFKVDFKYYKQRASVPSFNDVVDFDKPSSLIEKASRVNLEHCNSVKNMTEVDEWEAYQLDSVPGFYFIKNVFSEEHQFYWAQRCVQDFTHSPYVTNLDQFQEKSSIDKMWEISKSNFLQSGSSNLKDTPIWSVRWATLGYHHNWNTRNYSKGHRTDVPEDVARMSINIAHALGFKKYKAEASVVNFYHESSSLCPHQDLSELDLSFPLISVSFGLDAIFLIGSDVKTSKPTAIFIRSGDVVVMSGRSRTAYHALPRVMSTSKLQIDSRSDFLSCYLKNSRINLNVRQVESENSVLPED